MVGHTLSLLYQIQGMTVHKFSGRFATRLSLFHTPTILFILEILSSPSFVNFFFLNHIKNKCVHPILFYVFYSLILISVDLSTLPLHFIISCIHASQVIKGYLTKLTGIPNPGIIDWGIPFGWLG